MSRTTAPKSPKCKKNSKNNLHLTPKPPSPALDTSFYKTWPSSRRVEWERIYRLVPIIDEAGPYLLSWEKYKLWVSVTFFDFFLEYGIIFPGWSWLWRARRGRWKETNGVMFLCIDEQMTECDEATFYSCIHFKFVLTLFHLFFPCHCSWKASIQNISVMVVTVRKCG